MITYDITCSSLAGVYLAFLSVNNVHSQDAFRFPHSGRQPLFTFFPVPYSYYCERLLCTPSKIYLSHFQTKCHTPTHDPQPPSPSHQGASWISNLMLWLLALEAIASPSSKHNTPLHRHLTCPLPSLLKEFLVSRCGWQGSHNGLRKIGHFLKCPL